MSYGSGKTSEIAPEKLLSVSRFKFDIEAMGLLLQAPTPALRLIWGESISQVSYGFGDASGGGFGGSWIRGKEIIFRFGLWGADMDNASSNLREATNDVQSLETMGQ